MKYRQTFSDTEEVERSETPGCHGKRIYLDWGLAEKHARKTRRRYGSHMAPYRCPHCRSIHVGSSDTGRLNKNRRPEEDE